MLTDGLKLPEFSGIVDGGTYPINIIGDAKTLTGAPASTSPAANTLMLRDGNGYSYTRYLNQSSSNGELSQSSISQVMVTNGTDNFLRKASIGHLARIVQLENT